MPRARNKEELLNFGNEEFSKLMNLAESLTETQREETTLFNNWKIKDVLAHLYAWHSLFFQWYEEGMAGKKPEIPAPGYTFKDMPALNERIYQENKDVPWEEVIKRLRAAHKKAIDIVNNHTDTELTTKKKYAWTGSTNLASYLASTTSSHYVWATKEIKKYI